MSRGLNVGFLLVPRGVGTTIAMFAVSKLSQRLDVRATLLTGLARPSRSRTCRTFVL